MTSETPFNYRYFADWAARVGGRSLDYGCGRGQLIDLGLECGLDIWGADPLEEGFAAWQSGLNDKIKDRVRTVKATGADYPDCHFDLVICNQVIEHVREPEKTFADIFRLMKPGGLFLAAFPVVETWYEGHVGLYFAHWLPRGSSARRLYFASCHRLGFGLQREGSADRSEWVAHFEHFLDASCFYYPRKRIIAALRATFRNAPEDLSADYLRTRFDARSIPPSADPLLRFIYHRRAGEIFKLRKPDA